MTFASFTPSWMASVGMNVLEHSSSYGEDFFDLCTLALRRNPRRAQLIVSKVLAKHVPVTGRRATEAGQLLALALKQHLLHLQDISSSHTSMTSPTTLGPITVIGMAETATALAALVAEHLPGAHLATTTRDLSDDPSILLTFQEPHSHAATHYLLQGVARLLETPGTVVLIDDEVSHGTTMANLVDELQARFPENKYFAASLVDAHICDPARAGRPNLPSRTVPLVALTQVTLTVSENAAEWASEHSELLQSPQATDNGSGAWTVLEEPASPIIDPRFGVESWTSDALNPLVEYAQQLSAAFHWGTTLVIGAEEFMYPAICVARGLNAHSQSSTRSPIALWDHSDYPLRSGFVFPSLYDSDVESFLYQGRSASNAIEFDDVVVILPAHVVRRDSAVGLMQAACHFGRRVWLLPVATYPQNDSPTA